MMSASSACLRGCSWKHLYEMIGKGMVSVLSEVDTVKGEFNVPLMGISKGDVPILCDVMVFFCKTD